MYEKNPMIISCAEYVSRFPHTFPYVDSTGIIWGSETFQKFGADVLVTHYRHTLIASPMGIVLWQGDWANPLNKKTAKSLWRMLGDRRLYNTVREGLEAALLLTIKDEWGEEVAGVFIVKVLPLRHWITPLPWLLKL